ncbi:MAG: methyltransferase [Desulfobulbaceae bacterium]|nr:methyltransferase [Desulfobulbaceae bacterium]
MSGQLSEDTLFDGRLACVQHSEGYRFSIDAVLLAHFIHPRQKDVILDLGAGCGVISLILAYRWPAISLTTLELQPDLVSLIKQNISLNNFKDRFHVKQGDLRQMNSLFTAEIFDWVVCNPPYGKIDTGRLNPDSEQAIARHEIAADFADISRAISYSLKNRGKAALIYPANRAAVLVATLKQAGLEPKKLQVVHSYPGGVGRLVMLEVVKNGGEELTILPPFFIYDQPGGAYSSQMAKLYEPDFS